MRKTLFIMLAIVLCASVASAKRLNHEVWYQERWCADRGEVEFPLPDNTRVDCLTDTHAIEFDFADKWAEAIGQALYYAAETEKLPGIVLILEEEKDYRYVPRIEETMKDWRLPIKLWLIGPGVKE